MKSRIRKIRDSLRDKALRIFLRYNIPRWMVFTVDNMMVFLIYLFAYIVRFNFASAQINIGVAITQGLFVTFVYSLSSLVFRSYAGVLRHTTLTDITLLFINTTSSLIVLIALSIISRLAQWGEYLAFPISIILIHYVSITVALFFIRIAIKVIFRFASRARRFTKKVLIYGAGDMGFSVKRVLLSDPRSKFSVAGFIDDNKRLQGLKINGLPVYSASIFKKNTISKQKIDTLIIAIPHITADRKSEIIRTAMDSGLDILETPAVEMWLHGQLEIRQLQKVKLEDLLGRDPIKLNMELIGAGLKDKTILVTGAAGSIGSEIVRQLGRFKTGCIILVDQAETPMFDIGNELYENHREKSFELFLADITNKTKMKLIFEKYKPDIVFHAAAYKHVPLMEENPHEAIRVNVGGTSIITDLSIKHEVDKFVMISSDKSVNPTNVMGASKRMCELVVHESALRSKRTQFVITRFGNVLGSNGSVVPIFEKQIREGGPITVTHPEVTRYFMTIPEACELVLEAGFMGKDDEIFVFDMGNPVPIVDLAYQMIRLSGLVPEKDIEVTFTGLRPGEKLYEELLTNKENTLPTHHPKIKVAQAEKIDTLGVLKRIDRILDSLYSYSADDIVRLIQDIVPEYTCKNEKYNGNPSEPY